MLETLMMILLFFLAVFLILVILVQRGRGGGLAGFAGGMGGQSAFGSKAGDVFTRITMIVAAIWIGACILTALVLAGRGSQLELPAGRPASATPAEGPTGVQGPPQESQQPTP